MQDNLVNSIYTTSTKSFTGLNFDAIIIQTACNDCYADHLAGNKELTNDCFMCAEFTPKNEVKEVPMLDFLGITIIFTVSLLVFKILLIDIWKN